jgi:hypothetical protein
MTNSSAILAGETVIALGIVSWRTLKEGYAPLPNEITRAAAAWAIIGVMAYASPDLAAILGGGFLLALLIKELQTPTQPTLPDGYSDDNLILFREVHAPGKDF